MKKMILATCFLAIAGIATGTLSAAPVTGVKVELPQTNPKSGFLASTFITVTTTTTVTTTCGSELA